MTWTISTKTNCFEGNSLEELTKDMAIHFCESEPEEITSIYWTSNDHSPESKVTQKGIDWLQSHMEDLANRYRKEVLQESENQDMIRSDYYEGVL